MVPTFGGIICGLINIPRYFIQTDLLKVNPNHIVEVI